jgi:hypothetical protein
MSSNSASWFYKANGSWLVIQSDPDRMIPSTLEKLDKKIDDGIYNTGHVRSMCLSGGSGTTYNYKSSVTTARPHYSEMNDKQYGCIYFAFKVLNY